MNEEDLSLVFDIIDNITLPLEQIKNELDNFEKFASKIKPVKLSIVSDARQITDNITEELNNVEDEDVNINIASNINDVISQVSEIENVISDVEATVSVDVNVDGQDSIDELHTDIQEVTGNHNVNLDVNVEGQNSINQLQRNISNIATNHRGRVRINTTDDGLDNILDALNSVDNMMLDVALDPNGAIDGITDIISSINPLAGALAGLTFGALIASGNEVLEKVGQMTRSMQTLGTTAQEYANLDAMIQFGSAGKINAEDAMGDIASLQEKMYSALEDPESEEYQMLVGDLNLDLTDINGDVRNATELIPEMAQALGGLEDQAKATQIATAIMGTTGEEVLGRLSTLSASELKALEPVTFITEAELDSIQTAQDMFRSFTNSVENFVSPILAIFSEIAVPIMQVIKPAIDALAIPLKIIATLFNVVGEVVGNILTPLTNILGNTDILNNLLESSTFLIETLAGPFITISEIIGSILGMLTSLGGVLVDGAFAGLQLLLTPLELIFSLINGIIELISAPFVSAVKTLDNIFGAIGDHISSFIDSIRELINGVREFFGLKPKDEEKNIEVNETLGDTLDSSLVGATADLGEAYRVDNTLGDGITVSDTTLDPNIVNPYNPFVSTEDRVNTVIQPPIEDRVNTVMQPTIDNGEGIKTITQTPVSENNTFFETMVSSLNVPTIDQPNINIPVLENNLDTTTQIPNIEQPISNISNINNTTSNEKSNDNKTNIFNIDINIDALKEGLDNIDDIATKIVERLNVELIPLT